MKKMSKGGAGVGGKKNPNTPATVVTKATSYKGGISRAPATADKAATKYTGGKSTPPKGPVPSKKMGGSMKSKKSC
ncbi:MAG TPA: hypothetical protein PLT51_00245 [Candidatus Dojkabacteria bacterium]|jgi:hypothetical protein|nr:hypothetical protein [Candidatus Dojkabacteria bacterium]